MMPAHRAGGHG
uniref:Uncharacterized protein n=1 Tax=Oryza rufipogon TaxID=4529 RepID=A0A0E0MXW8_ORYRU